MNYADYRTTLQTMLVIQDATGQANLDAILPQVIAYAELRMYQDPDLDFLATRTTDRTQLTTAGSRDVAIPSQFIVVENINLVTPANTQPNVSGATRIPLLRTSLAFIDQIWPQESDVAPPTPFQTYYALYSEQEASPAVNNFRIAPTPDAAYVVEIRGTFRPTPLSAGNPDTFLTDNLGPLFLAASMVFCSGYQRNFGAQAEDPKMAQSWETQYQLLKSSAAVEEARKKSLAYNWSPMAPPKVALGGGPAAG